MDDGIFRSITAMQLESKRQEAIARNLAGASIPGFKRDFIVSESFKSEMAEAGENMTGDLEGTSLGKTYVDFSPGTIKKTERTLDFTFESYTKKSDDKEVKKSELFFKVQTSDGRTLLTKNGSFCIDKDMKLVTAEGHTVLGTGNAPITLAETDNIQNMCVTSDGVVRIADNTTNPAIIKNIGNIQLAMAKKPQELKRVSANYFSNEKNKAEVEDVKDNNLFKMMNGFHEVSNASPVEEMSAMISSFRQYEINSRNIKTLEERFRQEQTKFTK